MCLSFYYEEFKSIFYIFSIIVLCLFFVYALWPFQGLLRYPRICLYIITIKSICPITIKGVKFRDFIYADILTSFQLAFANLTVAICLLYCVKCKKENTQGDCSINPVLPFAFFFPSLLRIFQCLNLIYYGRSRLIHTINAGKYLALGGSLICSWLYTKEILSKNVFIIIATFASTYLHCFDMMIDWNIWHLKSKNFLLRDLIIFPWWTYHAAMVINAIIRYFWFFSLVVPIGGDWIMLIASFVEIYRRAQWCVFRIENEHLYNLEGYRKYLPIPEMPVH